MIAIPDSVKVRKDLPSGTIIISREGTRNALSRDVVTKLQQAFEDFHGEKNVKALILTGSGSAFCSGSDLKELHDTNQQTDSEQIWQDDVDQLLSLIETMLRYPKPIICGVNGATCGSGCALVLAADMVVASNKASLCLPESQLGLVAGIAMPLLAFRIGAGRTASLALSGKKMEADECLSSGIFHESVSDELVWARAQELANLVANGSHLSHLNSKQLINETIGETLFTQLTIGAAKTAAVRTTDLAKEGIAAFVEKRKPDFD